MNVTIIINQSITIIRVQNKRRNKGDKLNTIHMICTVPRTYEVKSKLHLLSQKPKQQTWTMSLVVKWHMKKQINFILLICLNHQQHQHQHRHRYLHSLIRQLLSLNFDSSNCKMTVNEICKSKTSNKNKCKSNKRLLHPQYRCRRLRSCRCRPCRQRIRYSV